MGNLSSLMFPLLLVLLAVPLFLSARKQKRAAAEQQALLNSLEPGDLVMTTSGLYGTVVESGEELDDTKIELEISEGVVTTWLRQAIREKVVTDVEEDETDAVVDDVADDTATAPAVVDEPARPVQQDSKK
ncbi:preprotein translocase subunit YajC [Actinosynnema sp. NPDC023587]|uniref:preprotein translocase subunit YajC n=1 Tax=Actinosynnema sp. NPDC023587 TaxID=3154695 RepID=UPI00340DBE32